MLTGKSFSCLLQNKASWKFDGVVKLPHEMMPEKPVMLKFFCQVHFLKQMYLSYENTLFRLAQLLQAFDILPMQGNGRMSSFFSQCKST
jgi:hypothetical protein